MQTFRRREDPVVVEASEDGPVGADRVVARAEQRAGERTICQAGEVLLRNIAGKQMLVREVVVDLQTPRIQLAARSDDTQVILLHAAAARLRNDGQDVLADGAEPGLRDDVAGEWLAGHRVVDETRKQFGEISLALPGGRHVEKPGR